MRGNELSAATERAICRCVLHASYEALNMVDCDDPPTTPGPLVIKHHAHTGIFQWGATSVRLFQDPRQITIGVPITVVLRQA